ncbi:MAG: S1-like domain-containing RNA-binding protein [Clostridia bacterium]|jgi:predicted RNA-binding protein (virulence factor B family)|nr:S1-like domain-containing RNA-binding protein [Clostridia bacterium]
MYKLGDYNELEVISVEEDVIVFENTITMDRKEVKDEIAEGDVLEVFLYSKYKATLKEPLIKLDEISYLKVVSKTEIGAFLDWGMPKDLLLPYSEQKGNVFEEKKYLVRMYIDKTGRLCASRKISDVLEDGAPYNEGDEVSGIVFSIAEDIGVFVAVDNKYKALIPQREVYKEYVIGEPVKAYVMSVKEDGKLDLKTKKEKIVQMDDDKEAILYELYKNKGFLPYNDKSSPDDIKDKFKMSKAAFKRAIGGLFKEREIEITPEGIKAVK